MNCNCIAGITTYNPNMERLYLNVSAIAEQVEKVIIVDNGSANINDISKKLSMFSNLEIIENEKNMGIAYAMNKIGKYAESNGYEWFLTLDQDSICPNNLIDTYIKYIGKEVGIIAPYIQFNPSFIAKFFHIDTENTEKKVAIVKEVKYAISSGQFIQTKVWKEVSGFWEFLFIDYVDQEFCFHILEKGYKILQVNDIELAHEPGIPIKVFGITTAKQNAMREYYWARNSRLVYWLYKKEYMEAIGKKPIWSTMKRIANVILVKEDVINKLRAIIWGQVDAYIWKGKNEQRTPFHVENDRRY